MTSGRRRFLRLLLSANRKLTACRWIGGTTVGVVEISNVSRRSCPYRKATDGAEKSYPKKRKRVRGLRKGKRRSRVGKTRSNCNLSTLKPKDRSPRVLLHSERTFTAARKDQEYLFGLAGTAWRKGYLSDTSKDRIRSTWRLVVSKYPPHVSRMLFGTSTKNFLDTIKPDPRETRCVGSPGAPLLPPRPGVKAPLAPSYHTGMDRSVVQKDGLGSDPCPWCRSEYGGDSAFCLLIQRCVRNPKTLERSRDPTLRGKKVATHVPKGRRTVSSIRCYRPGEICWGLACECRKMGADG